ncbi:MAG: N-6 DNA methylase [Acidimicrobiales bacterium]|nr:N-6 DNA methylase [Acidimicrobiales bacterium]
MELITTQWVQESLVRGACPLDISAAVARRIASQLGLDDEPHGPRLLSQGNLVAPKECDYSPEMVGAVYEQCLDSAIRRHGGVHYTPISIAQKLTNIALVETEVGPVCDPAVGGGSFLIAAANYFRHLGIPPAKIVGELLWGVDVDHGAVLVTEAALALWASDRNWILPAGHLAVADSLKDGTSVFSEELVGGFSAVIGNPPFQNQLQEKTVRSLEETNNLRERWDTTAGPYADTAGYFLLAGVSMLADDGVLLMIQPQSFLSSSDSAPIRVQIEEEMGLAGMWIGGVNIFEAGVNVCAPLFTFAQKNKELKLWEGYDVEDREPFGRSKGDSWTEIISALSGVPPVELNGPELGEKCSATAGFRDQFYGLREYVCEMNECDGDWAPLITVGMIDPLRNRWGKGVFRYANQSWYEPVVDLNALSAGNPGLFKWVKDRLRPKVLVATQTKVLEVLPDPEGLLVPSTPVISVECEQDDVWLIAAALSSPALSAKAFARAAGAALSSNTLKLSATQVTKMPLPERVDAWEEGAKHAQLSFAAESEALWAENLEKTGQTMTIAYDLNNQESLRWWVDRLPAWR